MGDFLKKQLFSYAVYLLVFLYISPASCLAVVYETTPSELLPSLLTRNSPPDSPLRPSGPTAAGIHIVLYFTTMANDPESDQVYYQWEWGDGNTSDWFGPFSSGIYVSQNHSWGNTGVYQIRVRAKDNTGNESLWSDPLEISIAPQMTLSNLQTGYIYFKFPSFESSFLYSRFLDAYGVAVLITSDEFRAELNTSTSIHSVLFHLTNLNSGSTSEYSDNESTDGFSFTLDISTGMYEVSIDGFDENQTRIDACQLPIVLFLQLFPKA